MSEENKDLLNKMFNAKQVVKPGDSGPISAKDEIICIVDRSGSMYSIREDAEGGLNSFIKEQQKVENGAHFTLIEFDDTIDTVCDRIDINEAPEYTLRPRNSTALLDAIGSVVSNELKYKSEGTTMVIVVTDGGENSSKEWTQADVFDLINKRKEDGWEFMFLAANQDAISTATSYGFDADQSMSFAANSVGVGAAYDSAMAYTTGMRTVGRKHAQQMKSAVANAHVNVLSEVGAVNEDTEDGGEDWISNT